MGLWGFLGEKFRRQQDVRDRRQLDVSKNNIVGTRDKRIRKTIRIPELLHDSVIEICKKNNLSFNDGVILFCKWLSEERIQFEVIQRIRARQRG